MHPYSAPNLVNHLGDNPKAGQIPSRSNDASSLPGSLGENDTASMRNIILVGHDIKADIEFLRSIGYELGNVSSILEAIDTADIFRALKHEQQPRSLGGILLDLELVGWNLHNAVSDDLARHILSSNPTHLAFAATVHKSNLATEANKTVTINRGMTQRIHSKP